jgi:hypothetical protein
MGINPSGVSFSPPFQSAILFAGLQPSFLQASFDPNGSSPINDCLTLLRFESNAIGRRPEKWTGEFTDPK